MNEFQEKILRICNENSKNTLMETLEIEYIEVGENFLVGKMPVTPRVHQPDGILHGGATAALAESIGSAASYVFLNGEEYYVRGIEITANHIKSIRAGFVFAKAMIIHKGRTTQLWEIKITDEEGGLLSLCKLTTISLPRKR